MYLAVIIEAVVANTVHLFRLLAGEIDLLFLQKKQKCVLNSLEKY
jgi:hypothetical protein